MMEIDKSIFKSYDIRGTWPDQLTKEIAYKIGQAFIVHTGSKNVAVGYDARLSSQELFLGLTEGIISQGAQATNIGQTPTEGIYFTVGALNVDAGIMITASHNPKEYNGFKMMVKKNNDIIWIRGKDLLGFIDDHAIVQNRGQIVQKDIWNQYIKYILKFSGSGLVDKKPKVVVDASNGVIGNVFNKMADKLPIELVRLNFEPDGNFPSHSPNPMEEGASIQIAKKIKEDRADFGFMFDGDADRIFLVDENGQMVSADIVLLLLAKQFLKENPGKGIAYNLICSKSVPEFVKKWGGVLIRTQVGFVNVREGLIKKDRK